MLAEFKEKTYEKYFGFELARQTKVTYSPDATKPSWDLTTLFPCLGNSLCN
jgi:hypothetical protein